MAPMVAGDKVLIGVSGGEFGIQGHITAYNMSDGSIAWRGYSQGPDDMLLVDPEQTTHLGEPIGADSSLRSEEHTSELQSLMRISYAVSCLKKKKHNKHQ